MKNTTLRKAALLVAGSMIASTAGAGTRFSANVVIDDVNRLARGIMGAARNSADNNQMISCVTAGYAASNIFAMSCLFRNSAGLNRSCVSQNPAIVAAAATIQGDSYVEVRWDAAGNCVALTINQNSGNEPKLP